MNKRTRLAERGKLAWDGFRLWAVLAPVILLSVAMLVAVSLTGVGLGVLLLPSAAIAARGLLNVQRDLIARSTGVAVERPYLPEPADAGDGVWQRFLRVVNDPATWRDLLWTLAAPIIAVFTAAFPAFLVLWGLWGWLLAAGFGRLIVSLGGSDWYAFVHVSEGYATDPVRLAGSVLLGATAMVAGLWSAPRLVRAYGLFSRSLLGPTEKSRLALRVDRLTETRAVAVDTSAAELRRIERDLHDGAQARLVAMGMSLGAIEHLLETDPAKAKVLLAQTRESSAKALHELRDLVRGIHPPVLADRGIGDAVKALALDHPLNVEVTADLPGRPEAPVESAAYFAVSEILTNAAKHSGAERVWVYMRHADGMLRVSVTDDGHGGASLEGGTGLRGIERRIGTFDGVLALNSPAGGPTIVTLELPCALS
ncbi:sensor histidine kinase [Actinomadura hibisca]|uniref:sensor histidine kinase n=1 Tax=Actinomadura hibisca TaxID=68565 RepID=UPI0008374F68|nr:sensor domain-containing protein [Actinomadura hibisca]